MKIEYTTILHQDKVRLENDVTTRNNPDSSSVEHLTAAKIAQSRLVDENMREKEDAKKETEKNTYAQKNCL